MTSNKKLGRLAGLLFLLLVIAGVFAEFYVRQKLFVGNDMAATAQNIIENQQLFRIGFISDLLMSTTFFIYAFVLHRIFQQVNKHLSLLMLLFVVISVAMYCQNMLNQYAALELLTNSSYSGAIGNEQITALSAFYFDMHGSGYLVNQIFYGLYLFPLGYMIYKSRLVPAIIGIFLILGCIGDLIQFAGYFLYPGSDSAFLANVTIPADIGEISLCLWLIIKGAREVES